MDSLRGQPNDHDRALKARSHDRLVLAEVLGYYGMLGAAAVGALLLH
jgi:hypothetical protein